MFLKGACELRFDEFMARFDHMLKEGPTEKLSDESKLVFLSDFHMGNGSSADDLRRNRSQILFVLGGYYLPQGYTLVLNGDIEDLGKFRYDAIKRAWAELFAVFDAFAAENRLRKIVGNHDLGLLSLDSYPYRLIESLVLDMGGKKILVFHGHQANHVYAKMNEVSDFFLRYLAKPFHIRNSSVSPESLHRYRAERKIYRATRQAGIVTITGHTHRPLFESFSKYDSLRWSIEILLGEYPGADTERRREIARLIGIFRTAIEGMRRHEMRHDLSTSLYEDKALLIPCMFNSGCATGRHGFTGIEIAGKQISLVHFRCGEDPSEYLEREALGVEVLGRGECKRFVLRSDSLDSVFTRIELLGGDSST